MLTIFQFPFNCFSGHGGDGHVRSIHSAFTLYSLHSSTRTDSYALLLMIFWEQMAVHYHLILLDVNSHLFLSVLRPFTFLWSPFSQFDSAIESFEN
jgi:hypothetical protein